MNAISAVLQKWFLCALALAIITGLSASSAFAFNPVPVSEAGAAISVKTSSGVVAGCGVTRVEIWAENIANLYGVDVRFTYDPAILQVVDADPNSSGTQITPLSGFLQPDFVVRKIACNTGIPGDALCPTAGIVWYAATQTSPTTPASGSGPVAAIDFIGDAEGLSALQIYHSEPVDLNGSIIPAGVANGQLTVERPESPVLSVALQDATTVALGWWAVAAAGQYRLYRDPAPYFDPAEPAFETTAALTFDDVGAAGNPDVNHFYTAKAGCSSGFLSEGSNRVGEFDFALIPGS